MKTKTDPMAIGRLAILVVVGATLTVAGPAFAQLSRDDIAALQKQGELEGWTFTVSANPATEHSLDELCGLRIPPDWWKGARFDRCTPRRELPDTFDWRNYDGHNYCTPVKSQGSCGSCWAFGTVGPLECNILWKDGVTIDLAEQWLVSCNSDGWSCGGGWWAHDYHEWKTDPCGGTGAVLEADFPYTASDSPCNCPYPHEYLIDAWAYIGDDHSIPPINNIKQAIVDYGPVSAAVYANSAMQAYSGGIFDGCSSGTCNHAVVLVGWDDNQGSGGVWFMRNSWGSGWGEDNGYGNGGYMRIPYGCSSIGYSACYVDYAGSAPTIGFEYPDGRPEMLPPGQPTTFRVNVVAQSGTPAPGTGQLHYSLNSAPFVTDAMTQTAPNEYEATLPAADCFDHYDWYVSAEEVTTGRLYDPKNAPAVTYSAVVATGEVIVFEDDFETDKGWEVYLGADTGNWERADPQEVDYSGTITQPEDDHTTVGTLCYITGAAAGSSAGSYDVDGGPSRLTSPVLALADIDAVVGYWRWYHISTQWDDELVVEVSNNDGLSWVTVETVSDREVWTHVEWKVSDYVTPTDQVRVRFTVDDSPNNSLVEALIDDFTVSAIECIPSGSGACCFDGGSCSEGTAAECGSAGGIFQGDDTTCTPNPCITPCDCLGDVNGDGLLNGQDISSFMDCMGLPVEDNTCVCADFTGDGLVNGQDIAGFVTALLTHECG